MHCIFGGFKVRQRDVYCKPFRSDSQIKTTRRSEVRVRVRVEGFGRDACGSVDSRGTSGFSTWTRARRSKTFVAFVRSGQIPPGCEGPFLRKTRNGELGRGRLAGGGIWVISGCGSGTELGRMVMVGGESRVMERMIDDECLLFAGWRGGLVVIAWGFCIDPCCCYR